MNNGPQAFSGLSDKIHDVVKIAKFLKNKNASYKETTIDDIISDIIKLSYQFAKTSSTYIATNGIVFTYFTNAVGEKDIKISIDTCLL